MNDIAAITASLLSLGLICAIYYCNVVARPGSWPRGDMLTAILTALLTGVFPLAVAASIKGLWDSLAGGFGLQAVLSAGIDLASLAIVVATVIVFRALVRAIHRANPAPTNVTPLTPRPASPRTAGRPGRKAA